jgi:hypothetical protein
MPWVRDKVTFIQADLFGGDAAITMRHSQYNHKKERSPTDLLNEGDKIQHKRQKFRSRAETEFARQNRRDYLAADDVDMAGNRASLAGNSGSLAGDFVQGDWLKDAGVGRNAGFLAIHACGTATDRCLEIAMVR